MLSKVYLRLLGFYVFLVTRLKGIKTTPVNSRTFALVFMWVLSFTFIAAQPAFAWDPNTAVTNALKFIGLLILAAGAVAAITLFTKAQIIPAIVVIVAAAFLYVVLDPNIMKSVGEGFKDMLGVGGSQ